MQVIRALEELGFRVIRVEGSHHMMWKAGHPTVVPVPVHGRQPVPHGTLSSIIRLAGLTRKQFFDALQR
jgi:predicted RNA binding protein YcfA (HicA-like mRNA interferase family)